MWDVFKKRDRKAVAAGSSELNAWVGFKTETKTETVILGKTEPNRKLGFDRGPSQF